MPTYTYRCDSCGHQFDASQRFSDDPLRECPLCGAAIRRVIHPVGVVFKGSGWYITDSRTTPKEGGESKAGETNGTEKAATSDKPAASEKAAASEKPAAARAEKPAATTAAKAAD